MITVQQDDHHAPGTWKALRTSDGLTATFTCPNGHMGSLSDHEILSDGSVHPSVLCTVDGCTFHEFIKLEGWQPG